jgi:hypothetical protein
VKRFIGWGLVLAGGVATLWGGYSVLTGSTSASIPITSDVSVNALTGGLVGLAVLTVGLVWVRD